jgi:hypothetical protein
MRSIQALVCGLVLAGAMPAAAQTPLFSEDSEVQLVIEAPLNTLIREARRSTDPHPGTLTITETGTTFPIELSARGLSRRTRGFCNTPPLRMNVEGEGRRGTLMQGQNRLKIVTLCQQEEDVILEYVVYRLYNVLTTHSYRARPARITYRDNEGRRREVTQFNFLVEDGDDVARRNNLVEIDVMAGETRATQLNPTAAAQYALFQFMISNLDWDMITARPGEECCHNSRLQATSETGRANLIPVPYDFDHSGFVDAPYATPPEGIQVNNVRQRLYRGFCIHNEHIPAAIDTFRTRRQAFAQVIAGETRLSEGARRTAQRYIDGFYEIVDDPDRVDRQIIRRCRQ